MGRPSKQSITSLRWLNFFSADVQDGIGPYLAIYLAASYHWKPGAIGVAISSMTVASVIAQTPVGAFIDRSKYKRYLIVLGSILVGVSTVGMVFFVTMPGIVTLQIISGIAAAIFAPAIGAVTLGMFGNKKFSREMGTNQGFNHAGNVVSALLAGSLAYFFTREYIFFLVAAFSVISIAITLRIKENDIDHQQARGCSEKEEENNTGGIKAVLADKRLIFLAVCCFLFHFANAAMLPLAGQLLSMGKNKGASLYMSACIIAAQLVMVPVAAYSGKLADSWGRKPLFLIGFGILPLRGVLYTLSHAPAAIVGIQLLDGVGAGIFGVLLAIVVADMTRGTGRYNLILSIMITATGIGASLSNAGAGFVVDAFGYNMAFLVLAFIAAIAVACYWLFIPETKKG